MVNTTSRFAFLYIGISNAAIQFKNHNAFKRSINALNNIGILFGESSEVYENSLNPCYDCKDCPYHCNLYTKTRIEDICIINALLLHTNAKTDGR